MRLALVSDVHADHWKGTAALSWKRAPLADVLLVAGDLHDDQDGSAEELRKAALRYPLVVWVDGNHEAYLHGADLEGSARQAAALTLPENVVFLGGRETLLRDGVLFVGACAWWDFAFCAPEREPEEARKHFRRAACEELWFNAPPADGTPVDAVLDALAAADFAHVAAAVTAAQDDPSVHAIVVLTHTVPHRELLRKGVYPRSLLDAAFYGSSLSERVPALDVRRKIAFWCYGHSHVGGDAHVGDGHVRYLSHPRGRPDDFNRVSYAPLLLELRVAAGEAPQLSVLPQAGDAPAEDVAAAGPRRKQTQHR